MIGVQVLDIEILNVNGCRIEKGDKNANTSSFLITKFLVYPSPIYRPF